MDRDQHGRHDTIIHGFDRTQFEAFMTVLNKLVAGSGGGLSPEDNAALQGVLQRTAAITARLEAADAATPAKT